MKTKRRIPMGEDRLRECLADFSADALPEDRVREVRDAAGRIADRPLRKRSFRYIARFLENGRLIRNETEVRVAVLLAFCGFFHGFVSLLIFFVLARNIPFEAVPTWIWGQQIAGFALGLLLVFGAFRSFFMARNCLATARAYAFLYFFLIVLHGAWLLLETAPPAGVGCLILSGAMALLVLSGVSGVRGFFTPSERKAAFP